MTLKLTLPTCLVSFVAINCLFFAGDVSADTVCRVGEIERIIGVDYQTPTAVVPCKVRYFKVNDNDLSFPWSAQQEPGYCEARAAALVEKFASLGWTCGPFTPPTKPEDRAIDPTRQ